MAFINASIIVGSHKDLFFEQGFRYEMIY